MAVPLIIFPRPWLPPGSWQSTFWPTGSFSYTQHPGLRPVWVSSLLSKCDFSLLHLEASTGLGWRLGGIVVSLPVKCPGLLDGQSLLPPVFTVPHL